jgi:multiple sugar transport system substrate-binding protein
MKKSVLKAGTALCALPLLLAACGGGAESAGGSGAITYWLWDSNQQPAYQACADTFEKENPGHTINIVQRGWDDYWSTLTTGFVSGTAPDVFTDHVSKYPDFVAQNQLLPLDDKVSDVAFDAYAPGLADLWVAQDGKRYGLPKDWDTVAIFFNKDMVKAAGLTEHDLDNLTWNPQDGGTYEKTIAHLTVDTHGLRGDEPGFDKDHVKVYGLGLSGSGAQVGQTEWSTYAGTTGWTATDTNPWGTSYNFNDSRFQETIAWWASLIDKGYMPPLEATVGASMNDSFGAGKAALNVQGSWMIGTYYGYKGVDVGIAPTPIGTSGQRASMLNGLADSVWAGTKNPDGAVKWVKFLGSKECQDIVAKAAVVFPAITTSAEITKKAYAAKGIDVSAFTDHVKDGDTFLFPITEHAADITALMQPAMDAVLSGDADASSLTGVNDQVNALFH